MGTEPDKARMAQGRLAGLVIAVSGLVWIGAEWAGAHWGWPMRIRALIELAVLGGFVFGLVVTFRIWRAGRKDEGK
jgi:apolipoprotein N-acyltransferase